MTLNVLSSAPHFNTQSRCRFMFHPNRLDYSTQGNNVVPSCASKLRHQLGRKKPPSKPIPGHFDSGIALGECCHAVEDAAVPAA
jgi:hypothetical protein